MKRRQRYKLLFVVSFWCVLFSGLIGVALLLFAPKEQRESVRENRYLAGFPVFNAETLKDGSFATGFDAFLSDGFFLRDSLVNASKQILQSFSLLTADELLAVDGNIEKELDAFMNGGTADIPDAADETAENAQASAETIESAATAEESAQSVEPSTDVGEEDIPDFEPEASGVPAAQTDAPALDTSGMQEKYTFWRVNKDGSHDHVYSFPLENIAAVAQTLNAYRAVLPEDGALHFIQVPYPQVAYALRAGVAAGWGSDMEGALQSLCTDGVYIHSGTSILEQPLLDGDYVYFRTDFHWAPYGAYLVTAAVMESQGVPAVDYRDFAYTIKDGYLGALAKDESGAHLYSRADTLELLHPAAPTKSLVLTSLTESTEIPLIGYERKAYTAFLYGTRGPWRRIISGFETGRKALVITDSYGNAFAPYLLPYYSEVHMVDLRPNYFTKKITDVTVAEYIEAFGVTDVIVLLSTASSVNAVYMQDYMPEFLQ